MLQARLVSAQLRARARLLPVRDFGSARGSGIKLDSSRIGSGLEIQSYELRPRPRGPSSAHHGLASGSSQLELGPTIGSGHIARIVTRGSARLRSKLVSAWLEALLALAEVSDRLRLGSKLGNPLVFVRNPE